MGKPLIGIGTDVMVVAGKRDRAGIDLTYVEAVKQAGAIPVLIPPQNGNLSELLDTLDGLVLAGGPDCDPSAYGERRHETVEPMDPRRQGNDTTLALLARERGLPTLGICLGMQLLNVVAGGTLIQDIPSQYETSIEHSNHSESRARHAVTISAHSLLGNIVGETEIEVNSSHHQAVRDVGKGLVVTATAPDGIVEGLEDPSHPFYVGVQWHPEDMAGAASAERIFNALVAAARKNAASLAGNVPTASRAASE